MSDAAELEAGVRSAGPSALWVLKKAAGSNAHGIMFLKGDATPDTVLAAATAAFTPPEDATAGAGPLVVIMWNKTYDTWTCSHSL